MIFKSLLTFFHTLFLSLSPTLSVFVCLYVCLSLDPRNIYWKKYIKEPTPLISNPWMFIKTLRKTSSWSLQSKNFSKQKMLKTTSRYSLSEIMAFLMTFLLLYFENNITNISDFVFLLNLKWIVHFCYIWCFKNIKMCQAFLSIEKKFGEDS